MRRRSITRLMGMAAAALTVIGAASAVGPAAAQAPAELREAIETASRGFMTTFVRGDAAGLAATYTRDGMMMPANSDFITGSVAIQEYWQAGFDLGAEAFLVETLEVEGLGETAYQVGKYVFLGANNALLDQGKFLTVWKREDGAWKIHRDMWTTSLPAPVP